MSNIDKQRILEAMGYVFRDERIAPASTTTPSLLNSQPLL